MPVCVFAFDCLYVDGETLLKEPLEVRRARMAAALPNMQPGFVCLAKSHRLQAQKPTPPKDEKQESGSARTPSTEAEQAQNVPASSAGAPVTDLVSEDEDAGADLGAHACTAAEQASVSTLEKQAPSQQEVALTGGEPAAIQCAPLMLVIIGCSLYHSVTAPVRHIFKHLSVPCPWRRLLSCRVKSCSAVRISARRMLCAGLGERYRRPALKR